MLPRKRARPNTAEAKQNSVPTAQTVNSPTSPDQAPVPAASARTNSDQQMPPIPRATGTTATLKEQEKHQKVRKTQSWYGALPTPPKAAASTSVAKEHILGGTVRTNKPPDLSRFDLKKVDDATSIYSTSGTLRGLANIPEATMDEAPAKEDAPPMKAQSPEPEIPQADEPNSKHDEPKPSIETADTVTTTTKPPSSGWFGWLSRTPTTGTQPVTASESPEMTEATSNPPKKDAEEAAPPRPVTPTNSEPPKGASQDITPSEAASPEQVNAASLSKSVPSTSWFGFWNSSSQTQATKTGQSSDARLEPAPTLTPKSTPEQAPAQAPKSTPNETPEEAPEAGSKNVTTTNTPPESPQKPGSAPRTGSTWAFWSRDSPKIKGKAVSPESGEIAVIGENSEDQPKPAEEAEISPPPKETKEISTPKDIQSGGKSSWRKSKRLRPKSMDLDSISSSPSSITTPTTAGPPANDMAQSPPSAVPARLLDSSSKSIADSETATKLSNNLLLPSFTSTYQMKENPSIIKQITRVLLRTKQPPVNHALRLRDPPKIRKAIAIGIHGLFPASYLRPMIGQPTGTSLRFATLCAEAIRRWTEDHGCDDCEIEKVALEGEGKIKDRVENLWKLMLNWIDHIRSADLVLIACHSQGVPVSIMLLEKLIDLGIITDAKIGVCAMAGVSLGPFPDIKSSLLMGSAAELWDFGNPESANSKRFEASLKHVLDHGARITFIGSIDDQLVPMESAIYSPANHANIYRAVFIDGRVHAPDFIAHLVGFALKLRNLGVSDHGLIRELSAPLAGSLYSGAGHSRLYYDDAVYDLAISHTLEITHVQKPHDCEISPRQAPAGPSNPYVLPWIMRGLLEEDFVKTELSAEADELLRQFDDWKPTNKALKDVKYRLEAVRSRL